MYTNIEKNTIVITKAENEAIKRRDSEVIANLRECRTILPDAKLVVDKKSKSTKKAINANFIRTVLAAMGKKTLLGEFEERLVVQDFFTVVNWFYEVCPEYKTAEENLRKLREKQRLAREAKLMADKVAKMKKRIELMEKYGEKASEDNNVIEFSKAM